MEPETQVLEQPTEQPDNDEALQSATQPDGAEGTEADSTGVDERLEYIRTLSADQLLALHPGLKKQVASLIGNHAQKQAKELLAKELPGLTAQIQNQIVADMRHAAEYDRLERLRKTDQFAFAEELDDPQKAAVWTAGRQRPAPQSGPSGYSAEHVTWSETTMLTKMARLSAAAQATLTKKSYSANAEGHASFEADADAFWLEEEIEKSLGARAKTDTKRANAEKLDSLADEPGETPEVGTGRANGGGLMTIQRYDNLNATQQIAYRKNNPVEYDRMINRAYARK